jgi:HEPN domain-containing protein
LKASRAEAERWWRQAENDLAYARHGFEGGFYAQTCFQCHQVSEKAVKALHHGLLGVRVVLGHSVIRLATEVEIPDDLRHRCAILDQYYIPTRLPNGIPDGAPFEVYTREQVAEAIETATAVLQQCRRRLDG